MKCGRWALAVALTALVAACGPAVPEQRGGALASGPVAELQVAGPGPQNLWVIHPVLDDSKLEACYTHPPEGLRLLLWSPYKPDALKEPVSPELRALRVKNPVLAADSYPQREKGQPILAFQVPPPSSLDSDRIFLAKVFRECAGVEAAPDKFRLQFD